MGVSYLFPNPIRIIFMLPLQDEGIMKILSSNIAISLMKERFATRCNKGVTVRVT